tara:strand:- start:1469 stop:1768 length:300 start_codon:yes stop_codon:yes gene_type:complete
MKLETAVNIYEVKYNVRIDYARPQSWFDAVQNANVQINPQDYVWVYDKGMFGKPLHKDTIFLDSISEDFAMERAMLLKELDHAKDRIEGYDKVFEIAKQ